MSNDADVPNNLNASASITSSAMSGNAVIATSEVPATISALVPMNAPNAAPPTVTNSDEVIDLATASLPASSIPSTPIDPVFQRDRFLLHQHLLSINARYSVCDDAGNEIMFVVRPTYPIRQGLAAFAAVFAALPVMIASILTIVVIQPSVGDMAAVILFFPGLGITVLAGVAVYALVAPRRHISFYRDQSAQQKLLEVSQDQKVTFRMMNYTVRDPAGREIGRFRKDYLANILRKRWDGFDASGNYLCIAREDSIWLSLFRRLFGSLMGLLKTNFVIHRVGVGSADGPRIGEFIRRITILDRYILDCTPDTAQSLDRRLAIVLGVLLDTAEGR